MFFLCLSSAKISAFWAWGILRVVFICGSAVLRNTFVCFSRAIVDGGEKSAFSSRSFTGWLSGSIVRANW